MIDTVVIVYDQGYISGGAAKVAVNSAIGLKNRGYRVIYFTSVGPVDKALSESGVEVVCINGEHIANSKSVKTLVRGIWNRYSKQRFSALLKTLNPNSSAVHIHGWTKSLSASVFSPCKKYNFKTFITAHEYFTVCPNGGLYNYKTDALCNVKPHSLKCFFCNCDKRSYLQKMYRNVRRFFMHRALNSLKPNMIYISDFSRNILEKNIKFSSNSFLVENYVEISNVKKVCVRDNTEYLFIGRISEEKAPELFCRAVTEAKVKGVVIGDGPQLHRLRTEYPNITFTGWLDKDGINSRLDKARCLVITSKLYETMGLTVAEVQPRGIPCIVPDKCAAADYINDGITGLLYNAGDVDSLKGAIDITLDDDTIENMGNAYYNSYDPNRFSLDRHISRLIDVYNQA